MKKSKRDSEPQYASFEISKVHVVFADLKQRDWMNGTPDEDTPKPTCTVDPDWVVPKYEYKDDDGNWGEAKRSRRRLESMKSE